MFYGAMDVDAAARVSNFKRYKHDQGCSQAKLGTLIFLPVSFY